MVKEVEKREKDKKKSENTQGKRRAAKGNLEFLGGETNFQTRNTIDLARFFKFDMPS